jgi:hypothetical protein
MWATIRHLIYVHVPTKRAFIIESTTRGTEDAFDQPTKTYRLFEPLRSDVDPETLHNPGFMYLPASLPLPEWAQGLNRSEFVAALYDPPAIPSSTTDLAHKIAQELWVKAGKIRTVEDMAAMIRKHLVAKGE